LKSSKQEIGAYLQFMNINFIYKFGFYTRGVSHGYSILLLSLTI